MSKFGFIGASGLMGHGIAKNLLARGHALGLTVHRRRDRVADLLAAGATEAASPAALAARNEVVFICVTGSPQVEAAVGGAEGLLAGRAPGTSSSCATTSSRKPSAPPPPRLSRLASAPASTRTSWSSWSRPAR